MAHASSLLDSIATNRPDLGNAPSTSRFLGRSRRVRGNRNPQVATRRRRSPRTQTALAVASTRRPADATAMASRSGGQGAGLRPGREHRGLRPDRTRSSGCSSAGSCSWPAHGVGGPSPRRGVPAWLAACGARPATPVGDARSGPGADGSPTAAEPAGPAASSDTGIHDNQGHLHVTPVRRRGRVMVAALSPDLRSRGRDGGNGNTTSTLRGEHPRRLSSGSGLPETPVHRGMSRPLARPAAEQTNLHRRSTVTC